MRRDSWDYQLQRGHFGGEKVLDIRLMGNFFLRVRDLTPSLNQGVLV